MGFRFRKSLKIAPGVRLNLSKSGVSASVGGRGATVNVSKRGTRTTVGIPGTGLSYTKTSSRRRKPVATEEAHSSSGSSKASYLIAFILMVIGNGFGEFWAFFLPALFLFLKALVHYNATENVAASKEKAMVRVVGGIVLVLMGIWMEWGDLLTK